MKTTLKDSKTSSPETKFISDPAPSISSTPSREKIEETLQGIAEDCRKAGKLYVEDVRAAIGE